MEKSSFEEWQEMRNEIFENYVSLSEASKQTGESPEKIRELYEAGHFSVIFDSDQNVWIQKVYLDRIAASQ